MSYILSQISPDSVVRFAELSAAFAAGLLVLYVAYRKARADFWQTGREVKKSIERTLEPGHINGWFRVMLEALPFPAWVKVAHEG